MKPSMKKWAVGWTGDELLEHGSTTRVEHLPPLLMHLLPIGEMECLCPETLHESLRVPRFQEVAD